MVTSKNYDTLGTVYLAEEPVLSLAFDLPLDRLTLHANGRRCGVDRW